MEQSSELKPTLIKNILLLSPGRWNNIDYTELEIQKAFNNTDWNDRKYRTLYLDHQDTKERGVANFGGFVQNVRLSPTESGMGLYGDLEVWNPLVAAFLSQAKAKFGVSATLAGRENKRLSRMEDFHFESFSVVTDPACKPALINLSQTTVNLVSPDVQVVTMENEVSEDLVELETEELKMAMIRRKEEGEKVADGVKIEKEHKETYDKLKSFCEGAKKLPTLEEFAKMIASDHVEEDKNYYDKLKGANLSETSGSAHEAHTLEPIKYDKKKKDEKDLQSELNSDTQQLKGGKIKMPEIMENESIAELATPVKVVDAVPQVEGPGIHNTNVNGHSIFIKQEGKNLSDDKEDDKKEKSEPAKEDKEDKEDKEEMSNDAILNQIKEMSAEELVGYTNFIKQFLSENATASAKEVTLAFIKSKDKKDKEKELSASDLLASIDSRIASIKELDSSKKIADMEIKIQELSAKVKTPDRKTLCVAYETAAPNSNIGMLNFLQHRIN